MSDVTAPVHTITLDTVARSQLGVKQAADRVASAKADLEATPEYQALRVARQEFKEARTRHEMLMDFLVDFSQPRLFEAE